MYRNVAPQVHLSRLRLQLPQFLPNPTECVLLCCQPPGILNCSYGMESCSLQMEYSACRKERCPVAHIISPRRNYINLLRTSRRRTVIRMWIKMMMTSGSKTLVLRLIGGGGGAVRIRDKGARPATLRVMGIIGNSWINPRCAEQRRHKSLSCSRRDGRWRWTWTLTGQGTLWDMWRATKSCRVEGW